jgi:hypothetical protein
MKAHRTIMAALGMLAVALLAVSLEQGCVSRSNVETSGISVGQQLQDLEKAHQAGTITDKEYKDLRKSIIKKYD